MSNKIANGFNVFSDFAGPSLYLPEQKVADDNVHILALAHSVNLAGAQLALASLIKNTNEVVNWSVVCPEDGPFVDKVEDQANVHIVDRYPWWCRGRSFSEPPRNFNPDGLNNIFDRINYDVALTNTITVPWLAYHAVKNKRPHMWYIHEYGDLDHGLVFPLGYDRSVDYIRRSSDTVLTVSRSVGEHLLRHGASEDTLRYISQSFEVESYLEIDPPKDNNEMLILGSIKESKGQFEALKAFSSSTVLNSKKLTIAGPVKEEFYAKEIADFIDENGLSERINFIPHRVDALQKMKEASTVLVCSKNEALGRITLEALAAGRTVVGSCGGGTETLLSDSRGVLYDGSVEDLTSKLSNLDELSEGLRPVEDRKRYVVDNFSPVNEREDFTKAMHDAISHRQMLNIKDKVAKIGKTGIISALRTHAIIK